MAWLEGSVNTIYYLHLAQISFKSCLELLHAIVFSKALHIIAFQISNASTSTIYSQQSFMIITGRRMSGCCICYSIEMNCIVL